MAEERTISVFTLTNTPCRNRQDVHTLVDQTMIRQWHWFDPKVRDSRLKPLSGILLMQILETQGSTCKWVLRVELRSHTTEPDHVYRLGVWCNR